MFCANCGASNPEGATFCNSCGRPMTVTSSSYSSSPPPPSQYTPPPTGGGGSAGGFSFGTIPPGRANFQMATAFTNAINLVKSPANFMRQNNDSAVPVNTAIINYVAILALIPLIATLVGDLWFYGSAGYAITGAITSYIFEIIGVIVVGIVIWKLAPSFGTVTDQSRATLLAAFVYTPFFLISIVEFIPFIGGLTILGLLYGLYILWLGLPIMLGTRPDKVLVYFIVILVVSIIVYAVIGTIVGAIAVAFFFLR
jgi:hypothetical protein